MEAFKSASGEAPAASERPWQQKKKKAGKPPTSRPHPTFPTPTPGGLTNVCRRGGDGGGGVGGVWQRLDCVCSRRKQKRGNDKVYIGGEGRGEGGREAQRGARNAPKSLQLPAMARCDLRDKLITVEASREEREGRMRS